MAVTYTKLRLTKAKEEINLKDVGVSDGVNRHWARGSGTQGSET